MVGRVAGNGLPALPSPSPSLPLDAGERPAVPDGCQEEARPHCLDQPAGRSGAGGQRADLYAAGAWAPGGADPRACCFASAAGGELLPVPGRADIPLPGAPVGSVCRFCPLPTPPQTAWLGVFLHLAMRGSGHIGCGAWLMPPMSAGDWGQPG